VQFLPMLGAKAFKARRKLSSLMMRVIRKPPVATSLAVNQQICHAR
jgi:hypothetical protein